MQLSGCVFVIAHVRACIDPLCCALFGQESSASFSVAHQSYHRCNEVEEISASVSPKEEGSTQVLISSMFRKDLLLFL